MCHNSVTENEQIEKCVENGMPLKIIKTIKYTMRKRAANEEINQKEELLATTATDLNTVNNENKNNVQNNTTFTGEKLNTFVSKCPFGHGKLASPLTTTTASFFRPAATNITSDYEFPNNIYERFPQFAADDNSNVVADSNINGNITNLGGHFEKLLSTEKIYNDDILAQGTQLTRQFSYTMQQAIRRLQNSKMYTLLTKTTQPAHVAAICILSFVLFTVWPELIVSTAKQQHLQQHPQEQLLEKTTTTTSHRQDMPVGKNDMLALIAYLGAFSTHFGSQIWMTFVSGLSLYFSLPRHMFGQCQQILFPKYFAMNAVLSITMLIIYVKFFLNTWTLAKCIQLGSLALTGAIEVLVRLYLAPPLLRLMHEKYKIEGTVGSGKEIGSLVQGDLIQCPHYQCIHKAFRRIHMTVAIGNMITMAASCLHLYYIANQLQISIAY